MKRVLFSVIGIVFLVFSSPAGANAGIIDTRHNLSLTGPGEIKALPGADPLDRICIFCHTPHNAAPRTPLWNKTIDPVSYVLYTSTTMAATPSQPTGPSRLCLSCHDGTLALGATLRPAGGIATTAQITGRPSHLGTILSGDHPFSFSYNDSIANPLAGLSPTIAAGSFSFMPTASFIAPPVTMPTRTPTDHWIRMEGQPASSSSRTIGAPRSA